MQKLCDQIKKKNQLKDKDGISDFESLCSMPAYFFVCAFPTHSIFFVTPSHQARRPGDNERFRISVNARQFLPSAPEKYVRSSSDWTAAAATAAG